MRISRVILYILIPSGMIYLAASMSCQNLSREELLGTPCDTTEVSYSSDVAPIIEARCLHCHYDDPAAFGPFGLENYELVKERVNSGQLERAVNHTGTYKMPKDGPKLPECELAKINIWIRNDAPNN